MGNCSIMVYVGCRGTEGDWAGTGSRRDASTQLPGLVHR